MAPVALFVQISPPLGFVITKPGAHFVACAVQVPTVVGEMAILVAAIVSMVAISAVAGAAIPLIVLSWHISFSSNRFVKQMMHQ